MKTLNRMTIEFIQVCQEIDVLYARKRALENDMKKRYDQLRETCGTVGTTIDDFEEV